MGDNGFLVCNGAVNNNLNGAALNVGLSIIYAGYARVSRFMCDATGCVVGVCDRWLSSRNVSDPGCLVFCGSTHRAVARNTNFKHEQPRQLWA
jgi:hypothetical protein